MKTKTFDCVEMKRVAQRKIRARVRGMSREEEIAFFRSGSAAFQQAIEEAKAGARSQSAASPS